jgi:hypothetical protein
MRTGDTKKNSRSQARESGHTLQARHGGLRAGAMDSHHDVLLLRHRHFKQSAQADRHGRIPQTSLRQPAAGAALGFGCDTSVFVGSGPQRDATALSTKKAHLPDSHQYGALWRVLTDTRSETNQALIPFSKVGTLLARD